MERCGQKTRDIQFFSAKNNRMVCVHTKQARDYAKWLEEQAWVESYETGFPLDTSRLVHVLPVDIRPDYLKAAWASDFLIHYADGRKGIRELVDADSLKKRAVVERLELSRRYWAATDIEDWKIVVIGGLEYD